jgi:hypothetical protein
MVGRRSPQNPLISRLTLPPETIPSCYRRMRHTEFQPHSGRHPASLLNLLIVWGDRKGLLTSLLDSNSIELRTAYADYARLVAVGPLVDDLLTRIGHTDLFYTNLLGRIPLSQIALGRLDAMLQGTRNERGAAACVLAMQATAQRVIALLESRDSDIREESADCVAYNEEAAAIAARLPKYVGQFAIESYPIIQQQVRLKSEFQTKLAALPEEQRPWRLAIADTTPGAFGLWGRGMRNWFEEQRFQSKLRSNRAQ